MGSELDQAQVDEVIKGFISLSCKIVELETRFQARGAPPYRTYRDRVIALTRQLILSTRSKLDKEMGADLLEKAGRSMDRLAGGTWFEVEDKIKGYHKNLSRSIR